MSVKTILQNVALRFCDGLKKTVIKMIVQAEKNMPGSTGAEKKRYVVECIDNAIDLPWYLEALDGPAIGVLVDVICEKLNILTDHDKAAVEGNEAKAAVAVEAPEDELKREGTVDEKLEALYKKYKNKTQETV